jgi:hypothetical protein
MNLVKSLEKQLQARVSKMIDRTIPKGGLRSVAMGQFPEGEIGGGVGYVAGLAQSDLHVNGSAAFSQADLFDQGSAAFGSDDLDYAGGSAAFGSLGAWGGIFGRLRSFLAAKKRKSKTLLSDVAKRAKELKKSAAKRKNVAARTSNRLIQDAELKKAQVEEKQAKSLETTAKAAAKEAVAPRLTREEAMKLMEPIIKQTAQATANAMKATMQQFKRLGPTQKMQALKAGEVKEAAKQNIAAAVGTKVEPVASFGLKRPTAPPRPGFRWVPIMGSRQSGPLGWKQEKIGSASMQKMIARWGQVRGLETVTQPPEAGDIVDSWRSDDIFGEPLAL